MYNQKKKNCTPRKPNAVYSDTQKHISGVHTHAYTQTEAYTKATAAIDWSIPSPLERNTSAWILWSTKMNEAVGIDCYKQQGTHSEW